MQAIAYRRAGRLLGSRAIAVIARILGAIESLLIVALLAVVGPVRGPDRLAGRGAVPASRVDRLPQQVPDWLAPHRAGADRDYVLYDDTGIWPLIPDSLREPQPGASARRPGC